MKLTVVTLFVIVGAFVTTSAAPSLDVESHGMIDYC